jgi:hypothetical protein
METKFQTSFIPKKPLVSNESVHVRGSTSIFMIIGVIAFVASIVVAGFTFFAKGYLTKSQDQLRVDLAANEQRFNVPLIEELKKANTKIDIANQLLKNHVAVSEALNIVSGLTAEKVQFSSFQFTSSAPTPVPGSSMPQSTYRIQMRGTADSFNSIAFQSDVFNRSSKYGTNKVLKNPVLSDLSVDSSGYVNFNFTSELALPDISYYKLAGGDAKTTPTN